MNEIGGYFELELAPRQSEPIWHDFVKLNSGRHALEYILQNLQPKASLIYLPYYTCGVVLEPIVRLGIPYKFYHINENFEIEDLPHLRYGEYIIINNYYGLKDSYVNNLHKHYKSQMIVDDAQALFHEPLDGMRAFYSPRKFVGVPDGGFAKTLEPVPNRLDSDSSAERALHLLLRTDAGAQAGFEEFRKNDEELSKVPMRFMSNLTYQLLRSIDYKSIRDTRLKNYKYLHERIGKNNDFQLRSNDEFACPMVYPFMTNNCFLREKLIKNKVYVAKYWPDIQSDSLSNFEVELVNRLLPLPIDQRYDIGDMERIVTLINKYA